MNRSQLADHIESFSPDEFRQLADLSTYMGEKASPSNPSGSLPEGSLPRLLNSQTPRVRQAVNGLREVIATPRERPFEPKRSEMENIALLNLDPASGSTIMDALDYGDVQHGVMSRMGTDSDLPQEPISTRDLLSAAMDFHGEQS